MVGEFAARHMPDVQLQPSGQGVWRIGHRIAAPRPVTQQKLDILPGVVAKAVVSRELQLEQHHIRRLFLQLVDPGRHFLDREGAFTGDLARLQQHIAVRHATTGQHQAGGFFLRAQCLALVHAVHHVAAELFALAGAAGAVFAAIGQADALAYTGCEHGLTGHGGEDPTAGLYADLEGRWGGIWRAHVVRYPRGLQVFGKPLILPSNPSPHGSLYATRPGALPARFRRQRLLIIGCGDVGLRVVQALPARVRVIALTSSPERSAELRARGITPLRGNLDDPLSLQRLAGLAHRVLHLAPPPGEGWQDPRTLALTRALRRRSPPSGLVYGSTSGVYGDCQGAIATETRSTNPDTPRARRRIDAEAAVRFLGRSAGVRSSILRIPGIYAPDRVGGTPRARLEKGTPVLRAEDDVYTNHIHADDLARACTAALWRGRPQRIYNVNDDTALKMGDYFDLAADLYGLPHPPRIARDAAGGQLPLMLLSFMSESRRLDNTRLKRELGLRLRYPTVELGLRA